MTYTPEQFISTLEAYYHSEACYKKPWTEETIHRLLDHIRTHYMSPEGAEAFKTHKGMQNAAEATGKRSYTPKKTTRTTKTGKPSAVWSLEKRFMKYGPGPGREKLEEAFKVTTTP